MIIPFFIPHAGCPHQCVFCNQKNITGRNRSVEASAIPRTIIAYLTHHTSDEPVQIAFYGGSFTALPIDVQTAYLGACRPFIEAGMISSIRLSTRPDAVTSDGLALLKDHQVKTIELGAQSMDDRVLSLSGRGHAAKDTVHAANLLRENGFTFGLQLMPGLPGDSAETFRNTVSAAIALFPAFVRIYPALVIKDTLLEQWFRAGRYLPWSLDDAISACCDALLQFEQNSISVIRIGLQPTEELERPGMIVAGPYHPAFRQLVESSILLNKMRIALRQDRRHQHPTCFYLHPSDVSTAIGQKRANITILKKEFALDDIRMIPDPSAPKGSIRC